MKDLAKFIESKEEVNFSEMCNYQDVTEKSSKLHYVYINVEELFKLRNKKYALAFLHTAYFDSCLVANLGDWKEVAVKLIEFMKNIPEAYENLFNVISEDDYGFQVKYLEDYTSMDDIAEILNAQNDCGETVINLLALCKLKGWTLLSNCDYVLKSDIEVLECNENGYEVTSTDDVTEELIEF